MTKTPNTLAAAIWMLGSIIAFTAMAVAGRAVTQWHDTFEIMTWRSALGVVFVCTYAFASGRLHEIKGRRFKVHFMRNVAHFAGQNLWFLALSLIPLAQVIALEFTSPIWVILLAPLFLGETITRTKLVATALGFTGTLIVARPDFSHIDTGVLAAAAAAVCFATTAIFTKKLTRHESIVSILFWLTTLQLIFGIVTMSMDGVVTWPSLASAPYLIAIGVCGLAAHFCLTTALSLAPASTVMPIDFLRLPVAAIIGWLLYAEQPRISTLIGAVLILSAIWMIIRSQTARNTAPKTQL